MLSQTRIDQTFRYAIKAMILALFLGTVFAVIITCLHAFLYAKALIFGSGNIKQLVEILLDGFVLIELLRSFAEYLTHNRICLPLLVETGIVFALREMSTTLYEHHPGFGVMAGYALLIPALLLSRRLASTPKITEDLGSL